MQDMIRCRGIDMPRDERVITDKVARRLSRDQYETPEVLGLSKFIKPRDRVLELGAGIGFISSFLSTQLEVEAITCVEANPELCDYIGRVHAANGVTNAEIRNLIALPCDAVWPENDMMPFYITDPFWSSSMTPPRKGHATETQVPVKRLSDLVAEVKPTVIVCDIEGGEETLFGKVDLKGVRGVYMELHTRVYGGYGIRRIFDAMHRNGFFYHQKASCADVVLFERLREN